MIQIKHLFKSYKKYEVLKDICLDINEGTIYALLGKNGAGKSTLINSIIDLVPINSGNITLNNKPHNKLKQSDKKKIGVVNESLPLISELNGLDYLRFIGKIYQIPNSILQSRIKSIFSYFFEDETEMNKNISEYSTGMKVKIAFCAAVIHTPDILILDEPFSGLDPISANKLVKFLQQYSKKERIIFISSHNLNYVEIIASHIGVLDNKKLIINSTIKEFTNNGIKSLDESLLDVIKPDNIDIANLNWI